MGIKIDTAMTCLLILIIMSDVHSVYNGEPIKFFGIDVPWPTMIGLDVLVLIYFSARIGYWWRKQDEQQTR